MFYIPRGNGIAVQILIRNLVSCSPELPMVAVRILHGSRASGSGVRSFSYVLARQMFEEIPERSKLQFIAQRSPVTGDATDRRCSKEMIDSPAEKDNAHSALDILLGKMGAGTKPTKYVLCTALSYCSKTLNWQLGLQLHARIIQSGHVDNVVLSSALVDFYAKCSAIQEARKIFDGMEHHDQVSWTSIISGCAQNDLGTKAILLFRKMLASSDVRPNCFTYVCVLSSCRGMESSYEQFHAHVIKLGCETNSFITSSLIDCYSKSGRVDAAVSIFNSAADKDDVHYNSMLSGYCQNMYCEEALKLFMDMRKCGINPTAHSMSSILNACGSLAVLQQGRQVHCSVIKLGSVSNVFVVSALIDMYSKCGNINEAQLVFEESGRKNTVVLTSMISGYAQSGRGLEGLELFDRLLLEESFVPDHICFTAALGVCNHAGLLDQGLEYFDKMTRDHSLIPQLDQYACLVDLYARRGKLREAKQLMKEMPFEPNHVMLSSFLSSCRNYGEMELGKEAADLLFKMQPDNAAAYLTLVQMYLEAGLRNDVDDIRRVMRQRRIRKSDAGWSWIEVDRKFQVFSVADLCHNKSQEIWAMLHCLNTEIKEAGVYVSNRLRMLQNVGDEN